MDRIKLKRAYEQPAKADGTRILVERLWPRGVKKDDAAIDLWLKDIAPSPDLRKWYGHEPKRWPEFVRRYRGELEANAEAVELLRQQMRGTVTFVFAARDAERCSAAVLRDYLLGVPPVRARPGR